MPSDPLQQLVTAARLHVERFRLGEPPAWELREAIVALEAAGGLAAVRAQERCNVRCCFSGVGRACPIHEGGQS